MNIQDKIDLDIDRYGRSVICVFPNDESDDTVNEAFTYTIGNWRIGLPELIHIGSHETGHLMNALSDHMRQQGRPYHHGELVRLPGMRCAVCVLRAREDIKDEYTVQATCRIGRGGYQVQQVVGPDQNGRFPWEAGCEAPYNGVLLYGRMGQRERERIARAKQRMMHDA